MQKARVIEEHKASYIIVDNGQELTATVRGSFFMGDAFPKVGDFVMYNEASDGKAVIEEIVPRTSTVVRKAVEAEGGQVIVANVDVIFIVMGLDGDYNLSRLERYVLLAHQSGVSPVILLNKIDKAENFEQQIKDVQQIAGSVPVHAISASQQKNMEVLLSYITNETTAVLLGSSGVGKSTITNWLLREDKQATKNVREYDGRGRHTTISRQLFTLPTGGYLIDTPGMRELSAIDTTAEDEAELFERFDILAQECQFSNCDHEKSRGCAILEGIQEDEVAKRQLANYQKLQRERIFESNKKSTDISRQQKERQKKMSKTYNNAHQKKQLEKES
jgi:ribosome biogenesis GTPase